MILGDSNLHLELAEGPVPLVGRKWSSILPFNPNPRVSKLGVRASFVGAIKKSL